MQGKLVLPSSAGIFSACFQVTSSLAGIVRDTHQTPQCILRKKEGTARRREDKNGFGQGLSLLSCALFWFSLVCR